MNRQRKSMSGDIPVLMPEGKSGRRPPRKSWWVVAVAILAVSVLVTLWRQFVMKS